MPELFVFCEDSFHEKFAGAMLARFATEYGVAVRPRFYSARGGLAHLQGEFRDFARDLSRSRQPVPDSLLVVVDANCQGFNGRKNLMDSALDSHAQFRSIVSYAIPDPHIERWMLVDGAAFRDVFGRGCTLPALKCRKDEYKRLLRNEIRASGIDAALGGEEFAGDIVQAMDLSQAELREASLGRFLKVLKGLFNSWRAAR